MQNGPAGGSGGILRGVGSGDMGERIRRPKAYANRGTARVELDEGRKGRWKVRSAGWMTQQNLQDERSLGWVLGVMSHARGWLMTHQ